MNASRDDSRQIAVGTPAYFLPFASAVALWMSMPTSPIWWIVWIAPLGWLRYCYADLSLGRRDLLRLWGSGVLFWALLLEGIRRAHWANYPGLLALASYLGLYVPAFVIAVRAANQRYRVPVLVSAPVVWVGLELVRGYLFTGLSVGLVGHALADCIPAIQIADLFGAYGVTFVVMLGSALASELIWGRLPRRGLAIGVVFVSYVVWFAYGFLRVHESNHRDADESTLRVAIIQGAIDTELDDGPDAELAARKKRDHFLHYWSLVERACREHRLLDVIVWPEGSFTGDLPEYRLVGTPELPKGATISLDEFRRVLEKTEAAFREKLEQINAALASMVVQNDGPPPEMIVGTTSIEIAERQRVHNSALLVRSGKVVERYYKMHPVPFGEYLPFGEALPWLYSITPLSGGLTPGTRPVNFEVKDWRLTPNICFESTVPHVVNSQVGALAAAGTPPDAIVNITDDGWFRGSGILDIHLVCSVFRAVENRRPVIVAANTGISAAINANGEVIARGPRREPAVVFAELKRDGRTPPYLWLRDWPATICSIFALGLLVTAWRNRSQRE